MPLEGNSDSFICSAAKFLAAAATFARFLRFMSPDKAAEPIFPPDADIRSAEGGGGINHIFAPDFLRSGNEPYDGKNHYGIERISSPPPQISRAQMNVSADFNRRKTIFAA